MMRIMNKVASGSKFAVFELVEVPTHLFFKRGLVTCELIETVGKEAVLSVYAKADLCETLAKLELTLVGVDVLGVELDHYGTHD
jgi:hypothetical protein